MNAAKLSESPRLQRFYEFMRDGSERSTLEIIQGANVCAVSACAAELRANGVAVECRRDGGKWLYRMVPS